VPNGGQPDLLSWSNPMWRMDATPHIAVRSDTELRVFAVDFHHSELRCVAAFPAPWSRWRKAPDAVAPDLSFAVFSGQNAVRAIDRSGDLLWEYQHDCWGCGDLESGSVIVTADGRRVWATAPSPHADTWEYDGDEWVVFDAATGGVVARTTLDCAAAGSFQILHPDGVHVGLSVGEGQDGTPGYWGHVHGDVVKIMKIGERDRDRVLIDVDPGGRSYLTVAHLRGDVAIHNFDNDAIIAGIEAANLPEHAAPQFEDTYFNHEAGYLTSDRVIVVSTHHRDGAREHQHWILDAYTAEPVGNLVYSTKTDIVRALGDGTWLTADRRHFWRWAIG
jgi:hypothetical protein